jgi:type I restriction system adenine methylase HsdM
MGMYASSAGKSGGEYYTPQEVSELLARITVVGKTEVNKVYDPACGSGSLLLKFAKVLPKGVRQGFFGQEINLTTYNLCRISMFLHDVNFERFDIAHGDTLIDPAHWDDEPFEAIVSNPPYSTRWEGDANPLSQLFGSVRGQAGTCDRVRRRPPSSRTQDRRQPGAHGAGPGVAGQEVLPGGDRGTIAT